jgi:hypothetical protein
MEEMPLKAPLEFPRVGGNGENSKSWVLCR